MAVVFLWTITRAYMGIVHDAQLYIGRALADLDPAGVGSDLMFVHDGQFGLSLFPTLLRYVVLALGPSVAGVILSLLGLTLWLIAMMALARQLAHSSLTALILVFVAVLPSQYGSLDTFQYREALAIPRPLAEASVLAALALWLGDRTALALVFLVAAVVIHPVMALPGLAVILLLLCAHNRRWLGLVMVMVGSLVVAGILNLPIAGRLFTIIDPAWRDILEARSPYLFPTKWPLDAWGTITIQTATLIIAAYSSRDQVSQLLLAVLVTGLAGVAVTLVAADLVPSLLIVQIQPWRSLWLLGALSAASLAICAVELWSGSALSRVALACLALGWVVSDDLTLAAIASMMALTLHLLPDRYAARIRLRIVLLAWCLFVLVACIRVGCEAYGFFEKVEGIPDGAHLALNAILATKCLPLAITLVAVIRSRASVWTRPMEVVASATLLVAAAALWDHRSAWRSVIDSGRQDPELTAILAERPGEVLWLKGGYGTWALTGRPNWLATMQGAGTVFSRSLSFEWDQRARRIIELGLADPILRAPFSSKIPTRIIDLSPSALALFCRGADAPAWIIAPLDDAPSIAGSPEVKIWHAPVANFTIDAEERRWKRIDRYAVIGCSSREPSQTLR
ncbi:hypothetical protein [Microvirga vignae]|uniref:hypothetical protein n=1 Tax=Microvirga vignae TaxID=1225564 RepID=UPI000A658943|nr:hypothetical protein [Microvirga vignae]